MIDPELETPRGGAGEGFFDAVSLDFCDGERGLFGLIRVARMPAAGRACALAVVCTEDQVLVSDRVDGERAIESWDDADLDGVRMSTSIPLERWKVEANRSGVAVTLEATASSPALELNGAAAGLEGYEQLCEVTGTVEAGGRLYPLSGSGRRQHLWGAFDWGRLELFRSLYVASSAGRGITIASARPAAAAGHGEEVRAAHALERPGAEVDTFEEVRLSTIYGADGLPAKAGLELVIAEEELPRRIGGIAVCATSIPLGRALLRLSFFRWSMEGTEAYGCYEIVKAA
jgi:hypothetical protein